MAEQRAAVDIREVVKSFGGVVAVDNVSLHVMPGEFLCIVGPSGCGKSTTLRMVAGFEQPTCGSILINGVDVTHVPPHKRNVVMVFQYYALFPHLNVFENVAFGLRERRVNKDTIKKKVSEYLSKVRLQGYEQRMPSQLSGGQQQRVALARALVVEPDLLLMDEPLGALDRKLRDEMQLEIKSLLRELNITTIYVTHDQDEALGMSDRLAVMHDGRIEQLAPPAEVYECPRTVFCATFLGISNLFSGTLARTSAGEHLLTTETGLQLYCEPGEHSEGPATLTIRPERVVLGGSGSAVNSFRGRVTSLKYLGAVVEYHITLLQGHTEVIVRRQITETQEKLNRTGDEVTVQFPPASLCLVEDTGK